jgi:hypothetical protein
MNQEARELLADILDLMCKEIDFLDDELCPKSTLRVKVDKLTEILRTNGGSL